MKPTQFIRSLELNDPVYVPSCQVRDLRRAAGKIGIRLCVYKSGNYPNTHVIMKLNNEPCKVSLALRELVMSGLVNITTDRNGEVYASIA